MGRAILIILISGIIVFLLTLNNVKKTTASSSDKTNLYYKVSKARAIASSAVEVNLNKLKFDKSYRINLSDQPLLGGYYDIAITGSDTVKFISKGKFMDTSYRIEVNVKWDSLIIPPVTSGLSVSSENLNLKLSGNIYISGNDINPDGSSGPGPNLAGITVQNMNDSIRLADSLSSKVKSNIVGVGSPPSISINSDSIAYTNYTSQYVQSADIILQPGTYSSGTVLGTLNNPKITFCNGDVHFSGTATGAGVLVVYGDLSISGSFTYYGLVIIYGNSSISASATGNSAIYGATMVRGQSVNFNATGNSSFYYSSSVMTTIRQKLKSSVLLVLNWYE